MRCLIKKALPVILLSAVAGTPYVAFCSGGRDFMYGMLYSCSNALLKEYAAPEAFHFEVGPPVAVRNPEPGCAAGADIPLDIKISQLFMVSVDGSTALPFFSKQFLSRTPPGAVLLFGKNIAPDIRDLFHFVESVKSGVKEIGAPFAPLICVDHEGGTVARLRLHTSPLPSPADTAGRFSPDGAFLLYYLTGIQMAAAGISLNLAPLAEFRTADNAAFLSSRVYSDDPAESAAYAAAAVRGFRAGGIQSAVKHFPGNTGGDPHYVLPVLNVSEEELHSRWLAPFAAVCRENPGAVLLSHVVCPAIDPDMPVCFSPAAVTGLLRGTMGFAGVVISDDLCMNAVRAAGLSPEEAAVAALQAGCSLLMISGNENLYRIHDAIKKAVTDGRLSGEVIDRALEKVLALKYACGLTGSGQTAMADQPEDIRLFCFAAAKNFARQFIIQHEQR